MCSVPSAIGPSSWMAPQHAQMNDAKPRNGRIRVEGLNTFLGGTVLEQGRLRQIQIEHELSSSERHPQCIRTNAEHRHSFDTM